MRSLRLALLILPVFALSAAAQPVASWRVFGRLHHPRAFHEALPIGARNVLVIGGLVYDEGSTPHATRSCEIIDARRGRIREIASMHEPRAEFIALPTPDGNVVAVSGLAESQQYGALAGSVELYDHATGCWRVLGDLLAPRRQHAAAFINDHEILVVGGMLRDHTTISSAEIFDTRTGRSRPAASYPFPINCAAMAASSNGEIVCLAGRAGGANSYRERHVYRYDVAGDRWLPFGDIYQPIQATEMLKLWDGRLIICGGARAERPYDFVNDVQMEDDGSWRRLGTMRDERQWCGAAQWSGDFALAGGGYDDKIAMLASTSWVNLRTGAISDGPMMRYARSYFPMVSVPTAIDGEFFSSTLLAIGGRVGWDIGTDVVEILDDCNRNSTSEPVTEPAAVVASVYPNPTHGVASVRFTTDAPMSVKVSVYNAAGVEVARLVNQDVDAGEHAVEWDGLGLPAGTYFVRLASAGGVTTQRIELLR